MEVLLKDKVLKELTCRSWALKLNSPKGHQYIAKPGILELSFRWNFRISNSLFLHLRARMLYKLSKITKLNKGKKNGIELLETGVLKIYFQS